MLNLKSGRLLRQYKPSDLQEIARLFYDIVHFVCAGDYSTAQLNAWASGNIDKEDWNRKFEEHYSIVAEKDGIIVGFGDISEDGYLDRLYVHKDYQHQGIATAICNELERHCSGKMIEVYASKTAKGFFEKRGYHVIRENIVNRNGIAILNFLMTKSVVE